MSRIGILFTIPNFITAGSGDAMLNIVRRLHRREFAPAVCVLKHLPPQDLVSRSGVVVLLADFFREPFEAGRGHTVSMLLTFSVRLERYG
jgi:hypothetical protein